MSGVAKLLLDAGYKVTGSDAGAYPPVSTYIESLGIPVFTSYDASNIPDDAEFIVIGKNAKLVPETNEEVRAAIESGIPIYSFAEVLGTLTKKRHNTVIAGSFGKSTTTGLVAWCLMHAKKDAGYFIGAVAIDLPHTSLLGSGDVFVLEGDEYPSSNTDLTSKFLHYHARDVLLISGAHDHVNIFPTVESYLAPFRSLVKNLPQDGLLVACIDNEHVTEIAAETSAKVVTYSLTNTNADYFARDISYGELTTYTLMCRGNVVGTFTTSLLGIHNIQNCVGASALLLERGHLTVPELHDAIASFKGIRRRLEKKNTSTSVLVYEGFGSSVHKARAAIEAMHLHFPSRRLLIVFEPYEFSWRNREMITWYDYAFTGSSAVLIYKPAAQGAQTHDQLSHDEIVERVIASGCTVIKVTTKEEGESYLKENLRDGDVVLMMSSGTIGGLIESVPAIADTLS